MPEPDEGTWRVRVGAGLLSAQPLSESLRLAHEREDERERLQAERDREMRAQLASERRAELLMAGHTPKTQAELFQQVSWAQDRADAVERHRENTAADAAGKPRTSALLAAAKAERKEREAEAESTAASKADVGRVAASLARLKEGVSRSPVTRFRYEAPVDG